APGIWYRWRERPAAGSTAGPAAWLRWAPGCFPVARSDWQAGSGVREVGAPAVGLGRICRRGCLRRYYSDRATAEPAPIVVLPAAGPAVAVGRCRRCGPVAGF